MVCSIVIPAYNSARTLPGLLDRIGQIAGDLRVLVVDDGSSDQTAECAGRGGAQVIRHDTNRGKGAALRTGIGAALASGADVIIQLDADGQHAPECVPDFLRAFADGAGDIILGAREFSRGSMPLPRRMSNTITSWILGRMCGVVIPDSQSGYRLLGRPAAEVIQPQSDGFDFESEYLLLAARAGFRIGSVPIPTVYGSERSSIHGWRDTYRFVKLVGLFWNDRSDKHLQDAHTVA